MSYKNVYQCDFVKNMFFLYSCVVYATGVNEGDRIIIFIDF